MAAASIYRGRVSMRRAFVILTLLLATGCPEEPQQAVDAGVQIEPDAGRTSALERPEALERSPEGRGLPPELWPPGSR